jgi:sigma-E factor negative regulatory protein RseC
MRDYIRHRGKVEKVEKHKVFVRIEQQAACSACHVRTACLASDKKEKIIEIDDDSGSYSIDEQVVVSIQPGTGFLAVVTAFVIPLALVIVTLITGIGKSGNEAIGGLAGLLVLIPYYLILYVLRDKLKKKLVFTLSKAQDTLT